MTKKLTAAELEFVLDAIKVMGDLNEQIKIIGGENEKTREVDANIEKLKESVKGEIN